MAITSITVRGARQHNLKNINVEIPRNTLTVITGLSGSGKSSLAFDTIYAEGQRRYVETLSAYARQFLDQMERPDVDAIDGLSPAIAIEQKTTTRNPRSTVGTITEIYDYLRLLYSSVGVPHCPNCGREISRQSAEQIVQQVMSLKPEERVMLLAPIVRGRKGEFKKELEKLAQQGYTRARIDGELRNLDGGEDGLDEIKLDKRKNHTIEVVVDRLLVKPGIEKRLENSVATAMKLADGLVMLSIVDGGERLYSAKMACPECGISVPALEPRSFSFNSIYGACPECHGLGSKYDFDPSKLIVDWSKPLLEGGLGPGSGSTYLQRMLEIAAQVYKLDLSIPFEKLSPEQQNLLLYGPPEREAARSGFHGILAFLKQNLEESTSESYREWLLEYMSATTCPLCHGKRLRPESLAVRVNGVSIADFTGMPVSRAVDAAQKIKLDQRGQLVAGRVLREIAERLQFLNAVGLGYISLDRSASTLSGGEGQRIRLATQIGSKLRGVLYVLDEPSIGLHHRDNNRLITALEALRDLGNTVLVVEHDEDTIRRADYVIDLGPGAGVRGGELVAAGSLNEVLAAPRSLTAKYLTRELTVPVPKKRIRPSPDRGWLEVLGARENNLRNIDARIPLGTLTCVTGVSGSGKSTLVDDILRRALFRKFHGSKERPGAHRELKGFENLDKVIVIDQTPIGRTPRSNPATYTGMFNHIRDLFAKLPAARIRGYEAGRFSFNVKGGRCEKCEGDGILKIEMNFLPPVYVTCEACNGRRYNRETLEISYKGMNIADVLDMTVDEAVNFFRAVPQIYEPCLTLANVGLGYIGLGQAATTLSGGEAQRIKLAAELSRKATGHTLYILDEPTTGLHFHDVAKLLDVLFKLRASGNTLLVIEHNLDVIKTADWILDLGPEGGEAGGRLVAQGPPETVAQSAQSHTGRYLQTVLP